MDRQKSMLIVGGIKEYPRRYITFLPSREYLQQNPSHRELAHA
jgi:hypothetical protein